MHTKVAVIIQKENKFLLVQENAESVRGKWSWVQGSVEDGEEFEFAARREVKEETGLNIQLFRKITIINNPFPNTKEIHVYRAESTDQKIVFPKEEILNARYFSLAKIRRLPLVAEWIYETIAAL